MTLPCYGLVAWAAASQANMSADGTAPDDKLVAPIGPHPAVILAAILKALGDPIVISDKAYEQRLRLMALHAELAQYGIPHEAVSNAGEIYMYCTYTDAPDKHAIKRTVNKWFRDMAIASMDTPECERKAEPKARPKILVPLEWFSTNHSMFRCYAPMLKQLRTRFELVGMYGGDASDNLAIEVFERILHIPQDELEFADISAMILAESPDIIFYPSIGMASWTITLSTLRLAPIQIMCPGHPASSQSPCIDYLLTEESLIGDRAMYSEKVVALPDGSVTSIRRNDGIPPAHQPVKNRVAIPAIAAKLIPPFMRALQQIAERWPDVEFVFFPNQQGLQHAMVDYEIRKWFPRATVHPQTDYQTYLDRLATCTLALDTFPFGGTNSVQDCFLCGVPTVTLEGNETAGRIAAMRIRRFGMPEEFLIAQTVSEYVENVVTLLKHPHWMPEMPSAKQMQAEFFGERQDAIADVVWGIYETECAH